MSKQIIQTDKAPAAIGPYSQGVKAVRGELVFTAGQIPMDPDTGELVSGDIREQTRRALENVKAVVEAGGSSLDTVSFGESKPAVQGHDESAWRWNRRAEFRVVR